MEIAVLSSGSTAVEFDQIALLVVLDWLPPVPVPVPVAETEPLRLGLVMLGQGLPEPVGSLVLFQSTQPVPVMLQPGLLDQLPLIDVQQDGKLVVPLREELDVTVLLSELPEVVEVVEVSVLLNDIVELIEVRAEVDSFQDDVLVVVEEEVSLLLVEVAVGAVFDGPGRDPTSLDEVESLVLELAVLVLFWNGGVAVFSGSAKVPLEMVLVALQQAVPVIVILLVIVDVIRVVVEGDVELLTEEDHPVGMIEDSPVPVTGGQLKQP